MYMGKKLFKIPRYVPEGIRNYNGHIYDPISLNKILDEKIKTRQLFVFNYISQEERTNSENGFFYNDIHDIIGTVKCYDEENIYVVLSNYIEFKNPVALISVIGDKPKGDPNEYYIIKDVIRVEVVEEDELDSPRIKK
jgi:hypothetical protein